MFILRFPQLAVSSKLLCLLMVICGAVPSMVRSVELFSDSSHGFVVINKSGRVYTEPKTPDQKYFNLTIISHDFERHSIYSPQTNRLICFNKKWQLRGLVKRKRKSPMNMARCQFREDINERGFTTFQSIANKSQFIAFDSKGRPYYKPKRSLNTAKGEEKSSCVRCQEFTKIDKSFNIPKHNDKLSGSWDGLNVKIRHRHARRSGSN